MYCRVCGKKINDDSAFCYACGNKVENVAEQQPQMQVQYQQQPQVQPQYQIPVQPQVNVPETNYNYVAPGQQNYTAYNQADAQATDYSYITGNSVAVQQNYNGYNQMNYAPIPTVPQEEVAKLETSTFILGLISIILSESVGVASIILGAIAGSKAKKLTRLGCPIKGKAKVGKILGKIGLILGIVMTVFWVLYIALILFGVLSVDSGCVFNI